MIHLRASEVGEVGNDLAEVIYGRGSGGVGFFD